MPSSTCGAKVSDISLKGLKGKKISDNVLAKKDWKFDFTEKSDSVSTDLVGTITNASQDKWQSVSTRVLFTSDGHPMLGNGVQTCTPTAKLKPGAYGKCRITVAYEVTDKEGGPQVEWQVISLISVKEYDE